MEIKVVCINESEHLKLGFIYDAEENEYFDDCWVIKMPIISYDPATDISMTSYAWRSYYKTDFMTLAEWRDKQINEILND